MNADETFDKVMCRNVAIGKTLLSFSLEEGRTAAPLHKTLSVYMALGCCTGLR